MTNNHFIKTLKKYMKEHECPICLGAGEVMIDDIDIYGNIKNEKIAVICTCQLEKQENIKLVNSYSTKY